MLLKSMEHLQSAFLVGGIRRVDGDVTPFKRRPMFKVHLTDPNVRAVLFDPLREGEASPGLRLSPGRPGLRQAPVPRYFLPPFGALAGAGRMPGRAAGRCVGRALVGAALPPGLITGRAAGAGRTVPRCWCASR